MHFRNVYLRSDKQYYEYCFHIIGMNVFSPRDLYTYTLNQSFRQSPV